MTGAFEIMSELFVYCYVLMFKHILYCIASTTSVADRKAGSFINGHNY